MITYAGKFDSGPSDEEGDNWIEMLRGEGFGRVVVEQSGNYGPNIIRRWPAGLPISLRLFSDPTEAQFDSGAFRVW